MRNLLLTLACGVQLVASQDFDDNSGATDRRLAGAPTLRGSYSV